MKPRSNPAKLVKLARRIGDFRYYRSLGYGVRKAWGLAAVTLPG